MKKISLPRNKFALVDDSDYRWLNQFKWFNSQIYAATRINGQFVYMHRLIMETPKGMEVDHRNGDGLDNRRINLRNCTRLENSYNSSGRGAIFKGVSWAEDHKKWKARITVARRVLNLGYFDTPEEAGDAYKQAAIEHHKEFARLS